MLKKIYYYIYFRIYSLALKAQGKDAGLFSTFFLSLLVFLNFSALVALLGKLGIIHFFPKNRIVSLLAGILIFIVNYFIFVKNKHFEEIIKSFPKETLKQKIYGGLLVGLITILSLFFVIMVAFYKPQLL